MEKEFLKESETEDERNVRQFKKLFALYDSFLDRSESGATWLVDERVANIIADALLNRYGKMYKLWAYVVMPNHVRVFLQPEKLPDGKSGYFELSKITQSLKGFSALEANRLLGRTGKPFWQYESFDYWSRSETEFYRIISYIENNPVKAGLVSKPEDWSWSSAAERKCRGFDEIRSLT